MIRDIIEKYRDVRGDVFELLLPDNLETFYFATILLVVIVLFEWGNIRRWDDLEKDQRGLLRALIFVTAISIIGSVLIFIGVI